MVRSNERKDVRDKKVSEKPIPPRPRKGMDSEEKVKEMIKPPMEKEDAFNLLKSVYGFEGGTLKELNGYDDSNYHYNNSKFKDNIYITNLSPHGYVLKIINSKDSMNNLIQQAQTDLLIYLRKRNFICPQPIKNKFGEYFSMVKLPRLPLNEKGKKENLHVIKLLEYLPGMLLKNVNNNLFLYFKLGRTAAILDEILAKFHHKGYETHESIWHLNMLPKVKSYSYVVKDEKLKELMEKVMDDFIMEVVPKMNPEEKQIIHGDLNSQNIICQRENGDWKISSIIDFGDAHISYPLYELAICMFYTMMDCKEKKIDCFIGSGHTLAGYIKHNSNWKIDYLALKQCISARLCQSYILGLYNAIKQPENSYITENLNLYPSLLRDIIETPTSNFTEMWENILNSYNTFP